MGYRSFHHLNVPNQWQHYWSKYPEGYTILEALLNWVKQVDDMVDNVNDWNTYLDKFVEQFDKELQSEVTTILSDWQESGFLNIIINDALQTQIDDVALQVNNIGYNPITYGAKADGITDDILALEQTIAKIKEDGGNRLFLSAGNYAISRPLVITNLGIDIVCVPYRTKITPTPNFVGNELIRFEQNEEDVYKGINLGGVYIDLNNETCNGITVINAYDQFVFKNVEVRDCNDDYVPFNFTHKNTGNIGGQTLLLENTIGEHFSNNPTKPVYYFEKYHEVNLIGAKAFANKANSTPINGTLRVGDCFYFKDCRGITMTGCSSAFGDNAVVFEAVGRTIQGLTIVGQTNEEITGRALKTVNTNQSISQITVLPIRSQSGSGTFLLDNVTQSTIYSLNAVVDVINGSSQNTIFTTDYTKVNNTGRGNSIVGMANYNDPGFKVNNSMLVYNDSTPFFMMKADTKLSRLVHNASSLVDNGISIDKRNGSKWQKLISMLDNEIKFFDIDNVEMANFRSNPANGYAGMVLLYRADSVTKFQQVQVGAVDSGGTGYRVLRVPN